MLDVSSSGVPIDLNTGLKKVNKGWTYILERNKDSCDKQYGIEEVFFTEVARRAIHNGWVGYNNIFLDQGALGAFRGYALFIASVLLGPLNEGEKELYDSGEAPEWMKKAIERSRNLDKYFKESNCNPFPSREDYILTNLLLPDMAVTGLFKDKNFVEEVKEGLYRLNNKDLIRAKDEELRRIGLEGKL